MDRSLYISSVGLANIERAQTARANNLANVNTTGFKRSTIAFQDLFYQNVATSKKGGNTNAGDNNEAPQLQLGHGAKPVATIRNFTQGAIEDTGNPLDIAINGNGFFQIELPDGSLGFTRDGNFTLNSIGRMVNNSGLALADQIDVPEDAVGVFISQDGSVTARLSGDGGEVDLGQIELARFVNPSGLLALGDNLFAQTEASGVPFFGAPGLEGFGSLQQGYLEQANVDIVNEMVNLIQAQRAYETNSKMVQTAEDMMAMTNQIKR